MQMQIQSNLGYISHSYALNAALSKKPKGTDTSYIQVDDTTESALHASVRVQRRFSFSMKASSRDRKRSAPERRKNEAANMQRLNVSPRGLQNLTPVMLPKPPADHTSSLPLQS